MTASVWHLRTAQKVVLALIGIMGTLDSASAMPLKRSGLTAQECYAADSECTWFCGQARKAYRYACFSICDQYLDHCLETGEWAQSAQEPGTDKPLDKRDLLSGQLLLDLMILGDTDGDGVLTHKEVEALQEKINKGLDGGPKTPAQTPAPRD
jgi:hypothetical protein